MHLKLAYFITDRPTIPLLKLLEQDQGRIYGEADPLSLRYRSRGGHVQAPPLSAHCNDG